MADGFKKYFNGTTTAGRANVAKATYASIALIYIYYRMRHGSKKKPLGVPESQQQALCKCDEPYEQPTDIPCNEPGYGYHMHSDPEPMPEPEPEPKKECRVCRERKKKATSS